MNSFIFQTVVNLDRPEEAIRTAVFLGAEQFHLFVISLPGQVLLDHCTEMADNMYVFNVCICTIVDSYLHNLLFFFLISYNRYSSTWYEIPVKIQKVLHMMQIRSKKPCSLTAGGLYEMNMENFGIVCNNYRIIYNSYLLTFIRSFLF